jgi:hypothetical protein
MLLKVFCIFVCTTILGLMPGVAQDLFRPANFLGIRTGRDTIDTVIRKFGKPKSLFKDVTGVTWLYYTDLGPVSGKVEVVAITRTQKINAIILYPDYLTLAAAKQIFGPKSKRVSYDTDMCLEYGGIAPLYESPVGPLEFIVYPELGIVIDPVGERADSIEYLSVPKGRKTSRCQPPTPAKSTPKR